MSSYILVVEHERDDPLELPCENDGTLLLSTLQGQYPTATGLKYKNPDTGAYRAIRLAEGKLYPPTDGGWGNAKFVAVFPKPVVESKRKVDDYEEHVPAAKTKKLDVKTKCTDLIALGIPWKTTDTMLREYFEKFGEVVMCQVKCDQKTGQSKGFGFVRFKSPEVQLRVLAQRHNIDGRWCEVQIPSSKEGLVREMPCKVFVGRITEDMSVDDLKAYFNQFGEVTDVYIPKPFRSFCFVTFLEPDTAEKLWGEDHIIKGVTVHVSDATPKNAPQNNSRNQGGNYGGGMGNYGSNGGRFNDNGPRGGGGNNYGNNQSSYGRKNNYNDDRGFGRNDNSNDSWNLPSNNRSSYDGGNSGSMSNLPNLPPAVVAAALSQYMMGGNMPSGGNTDTGYSSSLPSSNMNSGFNGSDKGYRANDSFNGGANKPWSKPKFDRAPMDDFITQPRGMSKGWRN
uniref:CSON010878 protein n=1 Tax=Culicoides sonorensis TaxID=179676 RepID=A0A336KI89_CULSO